MHNRPLGHSGLIVSELCLGAMTFGRESDEATSLRMLDRFVEAGGNFVDTADVYSTGRSEEILGRWLARQRREDLVIATKVRFAMGEGPNESGLGRKHVLASIDSSLRRLGTDYVDLYQIHAWDWTTPVEETLATLDSLVSSGKVRYLGASNVTGWQLQKIVDLCRQHGWERFVSLQPLYNLLDREVEWELLPVCRLEGLGVLPWSPLRGGWLTGRYRREMGGAPEGTRVRTAEDMGWSESWSAYDNDHTWGVLDVVGAVAEEAGRTHSQVALRWLLHQAGVTAPIIGARTMEHLEANIGAAGWELDPGQLERLTEVSARPLPYPYSLLGTGPA